MRRIPSLLVLGALLLVAPATAVAVVPADTRYAGGDVVDQPPGERFTGRAGDALVTLRTIGTTRVQAGATFLHPCRGATAEALGSAQAAIAADGSFVVRTRRRIGRLIDRITITGRIDGNRATGDVRVVTRARRNGRRVCGGTARFTSVTPPSVGANPAPAPAGAVLVGGLGVPSFSPYEVAFRVAADGASIVRFVFSTPYTCRGRRGAEVFYEPGAPIAADGTFRLVDRFSFRARGTVERGRVIVTGRFVAGGATGTVQASTRTTRRGRTVARCRGGTRTWTATP